jgi:hypothetical protein
MWFLLISAKTAIVSRGSKNRLIFTIETECVYCAVRAEYIHIFESIFSLKGLKTFLGLTDSILLTAMVRYCALLGQLSLGVNK